MTEEQRAYLKSFTVLVEPDDAVAVRVVPGMANGVLAELTLKEFGNLAAAKPPGLVGNLLNLHFSADKARELAHALLAALNEG